MDSVKVALHVIDDYIDRLTKARELLTEHERRVSTHRTMSASARKRISRAQRARWKAWKIARKRKGKV